MPGARPESRVASQATATPAVVHLWYLSLNQEDDVLAELLGVLSSDERERAAQYRRPVSRDRFIVARAALRLLLAAHVSADPASLTFAYGKFGKPGLGVAGPHFNVSHSGPAALVAIRTDEEVGVDVELAGREPDLRLAERFFSKREAETLLSLPAEQQAAAFLACWTRKEAFIKARGDGLSLALESFDVTLRPGEPADLLRTAWSESEAMEWGLKDVSDPENDLIAAVASRGRDWSVVRHRVERIGGKEIVSAPDPGSAGDR